MAKIPYPDIQAELQWPNQDVWAVTLDGNQIRRDMAHEEVIAFRDGFLAGLEFARDALEKVQ